LPGSASRASGGRYVSAEVNKIRFVVAERALG
jgi:hypothetical protein